MQSFDPDSNMFSLRSNPSSSLMVVPSSLLVVTFSLSVVPYLSYLNRTFVLRAASLLEQQRRSHTDMEGPTSTS
jgi:hypothetical protein